MTNQTDSKNTNTICQMFWWKNCHLYDISWFCKLGLKIKYLKHRLFLHLFFSPPMIFKPSRVWAHTFFCPPLLVSSALALWLSGQYAVAFRWGGRAAVSPGGAGGGQDPLRFSSLRNLCSSPLPWSELLAPSGGCFLGFFLLHRFFCCSPWESIQGPQIQVRPSKLRLLHLTVWATAPVRTYVVMWYIHCL